MTDRTHKLVIRSEAKDLSPLGGEKEAPDLTAIARFFTSLRMTK